MFQPSDIKWVEGGALTYTSKNSYWVARRILKDYLGFHQDSSDEKMRDILQNRVETSNKEQFSEIYPFLLHFLNLPLEDNYLKSVVWNNAELLKSQIHYALKISLKMKRVNNHLYFYVKIYIGVTPLHWKF